MFSVCICLAFPSVYAYLSVFIYSKKSLHRWSEECFGLMFLDSKILSYGPFTHTAVFLLWLGEVLPLHSSVHLLVVDVASWTCEINKCGFDQTLASSGSICFNLCNWQLEHTTVKLHLSSGSSETALKNPFHSETVNMAKDITATTWYWHHLHPVFAYFTSFYTLLQTQKSKSLYQKKCKSNG